jgi:hypothetical protein
MTGVTPGARLSVARFAGSRGMVAQILCSFVGDWHSRYARMGAVRHRRASFGPFSHEAPPTRCEDSGRTRECRILLSIERNG